MLKRIAVAIATLTLIGGALFGAGTATAATPKVWLGGGSGILVLTGNSYASACTLTTIGRDSSGDLIGLTAAHCGVNGQRILAEAWQNRGVVGYVAYANERMDYAVIKFDAEKVVPLSRVGGVAIRGISTAPPSFGQIVCKQGRTTGNTCGITWFSDGQSHISQACVIEGDSGSPVLIGDRLIGMVNRYFVTACIGPENGANIGAVLKDMSKHGFKGFKPINT